MFCYTHPAYNYAHPRELLRTRHRKDVLAALARLREQGVFDPDRMRELIARVKAGRLASTDLLQALLTVDTWYEHYA
jgi:hypothetical protein